MNDWLLAEATSKFSDLMTQALTSGPQRIRRQDQAVIVLAEAEYQRLIGAYVSLKDYLLNGPDLSDLDLVCDESPNRL